MPINRSLRCRRNGSNPSFSSPPRRHLIPPNPRHLYPRLWPPGERIGLAKPRCRLGEVQLSLASDTKSRYKGSERPGPASAELERPANGHWRWREEREIPSVPGTGSGDQKRRSVGIARPAPLLARRLEAPEKRVLLGGVKVRGEATRTVRAG